MIRALTAPIHLKTENQFRAMAFVRAKGGAIVGPWMQADYTKRTRKDVAQLLTQLPRPPREVDGKPNTYVVTLTRISPNHTDRDGVIGAFKAVRDEVAAWLGIDDGHARIRFVYQQLGCPKTTFAVRIEIEDASDGEPVRLELGKLPDRLRESLARGTERGKAVRGVPREQVTLVFRKAWSLLPWEQDGGEPVLSPLAMSGEDPPQVIRVRVPAVVLSGAASVRYAPGSAVELHRHEYEIDGERAWLYMTPEPETRP